MKKPLLSPWLTVILVIIGITIGYTFVMSRGPVIATADNSSCPHMEVCKKGECPCETGDCQGDCPSNCPEHGA